MGKSAIGWEYSGQSENVGKAVQLGNGADFFLKDGGGGLNPLSARLFVRFGAFSMYFGCEPEFFGGKAADFFSKKFSKRLTLKKD